MPRYSRAAACWLALSTPVLPRPLWVGLYVPPPKTVNRNLGVLGKHQKAEGAIEIWEIKPDLGLVKAGGSLYHAYRVERFISRVIQI